MPLSGELNQILIFEVVFFIFRVVNLFISYHINFFVQYHKHEIPLSLTFSMFKGECWHDG